MKNFNHKLYPNHIYHVYNRANGNDKLFITPNNYCYFLQKYSKYIMPIAETISYCLLPNHFHFLIRIKEEKELSYYIEYARIRKSTIENILSQQFSHFFNTYAQAFNKQHIRKGSLFMKNFNRLLVKDEDYLRNLIVYIHKNPIEIGLCNSLEAWEYSSYADLIHGNSNEICSKSAIGYFENRENFIYCHTQTLPGL